MRKMKTFSVHQTFTNFLQRVWDHALARPSGSANDHCGLVSPNWDFQMNPDGMRLMVCPRLEGGLLICRFQAWSTHHFIHGSIIPSQVSCPSAHVKMRTQRVKISLWKWDSELLPQRQCAGLTSSDLIVTRTPQGHFNGQNSTKHDWIGDIFLRFNHEQHVFTAPQMSIMQPRNTSQSELSQRAADIQRNCDLDHISINFPAPFRLK